MTKSNDLKQFWTRGNLHLRVREAMIEANLIDKKLEIEDLFPSSMKLGVISIPVMKHSNFFA